MVTELGSARSDYTQFANEYQRRMIGLYAPPENIRNGWESLPEFQSAPLVRKIFRMVSVIGFAANSPEPIQDLPDVQSVDPVQVLTSYAFCADNMSVSPEEDEKNYLAAASLAKYMDQVPLRKATHVTRADDDHDDAIARYRTALGTKLNDNRLSVFTRIKLEEFGTDIPSHVKELFVSMGLSISHASLVDREINSIERTIQSRADEPSRHYLAIGGEDQQPTADIPVTEAPVSAAAALVETVASAESNEPTALDPSEY